MKFALIQGERICEFVASKDKCFPVAPGLQWVEVADDTNQQDTYVDSKVVKFSPPIVTPPPPSFLARDLMAQLTTADYTAIQTAITSSAPLGLLWASLMAQGDALIDTSGTRFKAGWVGITQALGQKRADELAKALGF